MNNNQNCDEPPHDKTNKMACAQADLSLRWTDSHFVGFAFVMRWLIHIHVCELSNLVRLKNSLFKKTVI